MQHSIRPRSYWLCGAAFVVGCTGAAAFVEGPNPALTPTSGPALPAASGSAEPSAASVTIDADAPIDGGTRN
jgi:hypothetical protein